MNYPLTAGERLVPKKAGPRPPSPPRGKTPPKPRPPRRGGGWFGLFGWLALILVGIVGLGAYGLYQRFTTGLPSVDSLRDYHPPVVSRVFASNGRLLADLGPENRIYAPYAEIPPIVRKAFIAAEDRNFWYHPGVDPLAIARAAVWDVLHIGTGRRPLGASTITEQVVKNILLDQPMTLDLKVQEAILAMRLERVLSKKQILTIYLNEIYLGHGAYGVEAAAKTYFAKPLDKVTLAEAALLGGLPKAPSTYNPFVNPKGALIRRNWVLGRMADDGAITEAMAKKAERAPLVPRSAPSIKPLPEAGYFAAAVKDELIKRFGEKKATEGGLIVRTSLDPKLQRAAEKSLRAGLMVYDRAHGGWRGPVAELPVGKDFARAWPAELAGITPPPGMLDAWRLGVVLSETAGEAKVGWLAKAPADAADEPARAATHTGTLRLAGLAWARPVEKGGWLGPSPRSLADIARVGAVIMVEPDAPPAPKGAAHGAASTLTLRQIPKVEGALVSLDPRTGRVLALAGGWSYRKSQFDRVINAQRQPGSGFKPFTYLAALEDGIPPDQRFLDAPFVVDTDNGPWRPSDFDPGFMGPITMQLGLEQSVNLATLRIAQRVGLAKVAKIAEAFGVVDKAPLYYPIVLGALDTTVMRMAGAYASFDELGRKVTPTLIDSVADPDGKIIWRSPNVACTNCVGGSANDPPEIVSKEPRIADAASTYQLVTMMRGVVERGTGVAAGKGIDRPIAGKTGTTDNFNDAWFNGFTPNLVTIVWVGYDHPRSLGRDVTGGEVSAPIWNSFMKVALEGQPVLHWKMPPGLVMRSFSTADGTATDAFKTGPGPNAVIAAGSALDGVGSGGGNSVGANAPGTSGSGGSSGGLDAGMAGLY